MAAPTEIYVDPSIAGNSGAGTIGDPYGDLQHALDSVTRDTSNGDRFNIKAGTDEILSSALSFATYGTPSQFAPCTFQGYTSAAGDGGIGGISGNGSVAIISGSTPGVGFIDMHLHNCGSAAILTLGADGYIFRCELDDTTGDGVVFSAPCMIRGSHFHNIGGKGVDFSSGSGGVVVVGNYFKNETNDFTTCIDVDSLFDPVVVERNIFSVDGSTIGIKSGDGQCTIKNNSIFSNGGTGTGIVVDPSWEFSTEVLNNLVEGFSGTGGKGIDYGSFFVLLGKNAAYNNATNYNGTASILLDLGDNETLSASPFAKSGSDTFANRFTYFAPVDTGNVFGGAFQ